ncbi:MAG: HlyD family secretion protein [Nitrospirae bacterium]|nr:HlyD family secretion protein [Nitrospirota bacterium]
MKKRIAIISIIVLLIIAGIFIYSLLKEKPLEKIVTTGIVEGTEVNLASKISGRISEICCREGDAVQKDAVVISLVSDDLKAAVEQAIASLERAKADERSAAAMIESSRADLNAAKADVKNREADVEKSKVQMDDAKKQMERMTSLFEENLASQADEDRVVTAYGSSRAAYESSRAGHEASLSRVEQSLSQINYSQTLLSSAKARLKEAEAALSIQKARLDDTAIKTPISGTVVFKAMEAGEFASPGITVLTIVDMQNLWVRIDVEENLIGHIRAGSEARVTVEGMEKKSISGRVYKIGRYAEFATQRDVRQGVQDIKTFHVEIRVEDNGQVLKPGMTVSVEIPVRK